MPATAFSISRGQSRIPWDLGSASDDRLGERGRREEQESEEGPGAIRPIDRIDERSALSLVSAAGTRPGKAFSLQRVTLQASQRVRHKWRALPMPWYASGFLAGALAPLALWSLGIREAFQAGATTGLTRYADTMVVSVPIALAGAYLIHLIGA